MTQRVLLIDDHTLFREGLQELLSRRNIETVGAVGDGETGIRLARELLPDVILLDMRMPTMNGLEVLRRLRQSGLRMPIVMLTTSTAESDLIECLRNGAQGYLLKEMEPADLVAALEDIIQGKTVVAPHLAQLLVRVVQGQAETEDDASGPFDTLTPREGEILNLLAEGQSNKVIARNLGISDGTVKLHVKAILRKLGVHSRVEAAVLAVQHNLSQIPARVSESSNEE
jgi:two-component system, NarL family, nitrate/nitrite response regulator NarL